MSFYATGPDDDTPTVPTVLPVAHIQARARARVWGRGAVWALDGARSTLVARYVRADGGDIRPAPLT